MLKSLFFFLFFSSFLSVLSQNKTDNYIAKYSQIAIDEMNAYNVPASITLAQGILESGNGESRLAIEGNNHFGIKCHNDWEGKTIIEDDDEKGECFRKYDKVTDSYRDHSLFLTERDRYAFLFTYKTTAYKKWAKGLKKAGYATNSKYPTLLIDLIEKYNLSRFDKEAQQQKNLYFAHSYGLPYLSGIGVYYFQKKHLIFTELNTSYLFSGASIGWDYELVNKFYFGGNTGIIYLPTKATDVIPHISSEIIYRKNTCLIRVGGQFPLAEMEYQVIPYLRFTYLLN